MERDKGASRQHTDAQVTAEQWADEFTHAQGESTDDWAEAYMAATDPGRWADEFSASARGVDLPVGEGLDDLEGVWEQMRGASNADRVQEGSAVSETGEYRFEPDNPYVSQGRPFDALVAEAGEARAAGRRERLVVCLHGQDRRGEEGNFLGLFLEFCF